MNWESILKNSLIDSLPLYLSGIYSLDMFISFSDQVKQRNPTQYNGLKNSLKLYSQNKTKYLKDKGFTKEKFPDARKKLDVLLKKIGTKKRGSATNIESQLRELKNTAESNPTAKNLENFTNFYEEHSKVGENIPAISGFYRKIQRGSPYVIVKFTEMEKISKNSDEFKKFVEETGGKIVGDEIHYEKMDKVDDWFRVLKEISDGKRENTPISVADYIRRGRPSVNLGAKTYSLPEPTKYKAKEFSLEDLKEYLTLIDESKLTNSRYIPTSDITSPAGISLKGIFDLLGTTGKGKNFKFNPFLEVLIFRDITGSGWFDALMRQTRITQIIPQGQLKSMIKEDLKNAFSEGLSKSKLFGIETDFEEVTLLQQIDAMDLSPYIASEERKFQNTLPIGNSTKELIEWLERNYSSIYPEDEDGWNRMEGVEYEPFIIEGYYYLTKNNEPLQPKEVSEIISDVKRVTDTKKEQIKEIEGSELTLNLDNIEAFVFSLSDFDKLFTVPNLMEIVRTHKIGNTRLSGFQPNDIIKLFYELDKRLGDDNVGDYYKQLDKNQADINKRPTQKRKDRRKLTRKLNTYLESMIERFGLGLAKAFQQRLDQLLQNGIVEDEQANKKTNRVKLPQNLFNKLSSRQLITEV